MALEPVTPLLAGSCACIIITLLYVAYVWIRLHDDATLAHQYAHAPLERAHLVSRCVCVCAPLCLILSQHPS